MRNNRDERAAEMLERKRQDAVLNSARIAGDQIRFFRKRICAVE
ncbi:MAG: hypothetical protein Q4A78_12470 [Peptostreptococcaceae bacterium]|nr:hypothetical protein [Peptostreptococcaceae bacterium]